MAIETGFDTDYDATDGWPTLSMEELEAIVRAAHERRLRAINPRQSQIRDIRRAYMVREAAGDATTIMLDCNQQWTLPQSIKMGLDRATCRRPGAK